MTTRVDDLLFAAELSARYHRRRAAFLDRTSSIMSVVILAGGAGAFASLFGETTTFARIATLVVALVGIVQVVFRVDQCAAEQRRWLKQWLAMIADIRRHDTHEAGQIANWSDERYVIESECVGELRALQVDCYNRALIATGSPDRPTPMRWWHRAFIQIASFEGAFANPLPPVDTLAEARPLTRWERITDW